MVPGTKWLLGLVIRLENEDGEPCNNWGSCLKESQERPVGNPGTEKHILKRYCTELRGQECALSCDGLDYSWLVLFNVVGRQGEAQPRSGEEKKKK